MNAKSKLEISLLVAYLIFQQKHFLIFHAMGAKNQMENKLVKISQEIDNINNRINECWKKIPKEIRSELDSLEKKKKSWIGKYSYFLRKAGDKNARTSNKKRY